MEVIPGHRPARPAVRPPVPGRLLARDRVQRRSRGTGPPLPERRPAPAARRRPGRRPDRQSAEHGPDQRHGQPGRCRRAGRRRPARPRQGAGVARRRRRPGRRRLSRCRAARHSPWNGWTGSAPSTWSSPSMSGFRRARIRSSSRAAGSRTAAAASGTCSSASAARGARHFLCTDIAQDGTLAGPNLDLYRECARRFPQAAVIASGGVGSLDDLRQLATTGAAAVVTGKALLDGRLTLEEIESFSRAA